MASSMATFAKLACLSGLALAAADTNPGLDYMNQYVGGGQSGMNYQQYMDKYTGGVGQTGGNSQNYQQYTDNYASKYMGGEGGRYESFQHMGGAGQKDAGQSYIDQYANSRHGEKAATEAASPTPALPCFWRQTGGCSANGRDRQPSQDMPCSAQVPLGASGFCDCDGDGTMGRNEPGYGCSETPGTCNKVCFGNMALAAQASGAGVFFFVVVGASALASVGFLGLSSPRFLPRSASWGFLKSAVVVVDEEDEPERAPHQAPYHSLIA